MAISLAHKSVTVDINNRNAPNIVTIANVNDKAVRYLDVTLTASGDKLTFTGCTATATFATDGVLIDDAVVCTLNNTADLITVPLENFKSLSGFLAIEIKISNGETQVLNTPLTLKVQVTPSLADNSKINKDSIGTAAEICREVATARGDYDNLNARLDGIDTTVANKADKSTVSQLSARLQSAETAIAGKANATDVNNALKAKEDNANKVSVKSSVTDSAKNYPNIEYLNNYYYDMLESYSAEETDELLATKYDSANIESGTATLTPYSTVTDKIKSASCTYKTIGDVVLMDVDIVMNAVTMGANSSYPLIDLPYKNVSANAKYFVGISSGNKLLKGSVPKNNTWLQFSAQDKTAYTFADGEQINFSLLYKIK